MKVLLDARYITPRRTGVGYYTQNLLQALTELNEIEIHALYHDPFKTPLQKDFLHFVNVAFDVHPRGDVFRNITLVSFLKKYHFDIIHFPAFYSIQRSVPVSQVVTIHDLAIYDYPESFPMRFRAYLKCMIYSTSHKADLILTSSRFTQNRLVKRYPYVEKKTRVVPLGVGSHFFQNKVTERKSILNHYILQSPFILSVATLEPRKNLMRLLDAYAIYRRRTREPLPLVLVGKKGLTSRTILDRIEQRDLGYSVRWLDYVSDDELYFLYQSAKFMVYPSLYEGFGLPVLEAMASGCPVITADATSIPEVGGQAVVSVDPQSPLEIAEAMILLDMNDDLRFKLKNRGLKRARRFTWQKTARMIIEMYREVYERRKTGHGE